MKKLIQGIVDFQQKLTDEQRDLFARLALGQKPDSLFIACSDSRVVPNLFASTNPGDLFVLRNIGNLIPPFNSTDPDACTVSVLEFSIKALNVADIIVCGHSECGAMRVISGDIDMSCCEHLCCWLKHGAPALDAVRNGGGLNPELTEYNQLSQQNVLQQIEHLKTYPFIQERLEKKQLQLHGWWFDIAHADVYCYEPAVSQFVLIDENEAKIILDRLG